MRSRIALILVCVLGLSMALQSCLLLVWEYRSGVDKMHHSAVALLEMVSRDPAWLSCRRPLAELSGLEHVFLLSREDDTISLDEVVGFYQSRGDAALSASRLLTPETVSRLEGLIRANGQSAWMGIDYGKSWLALFPRYQIIGIVARRQAGNDTIVVGIQSLKALYDQLRPAVVLAGVYLTINVLLFWSIAFFRIDRLLTRPLEKIVARAESFSFDDDLPFADLGARGELSRLSAGLDRMLARIQQDKVELEQYVRSLEESNRELARTRREVVRIEKLAAMGRLAAGLAHEVGNPLGIIRGYVELLGRPGLEDGERTDFARRTLGEVDRISRLLRQLLDLSRSGGGQVGPVAVHDILRETVGLVRTQPEFRTVSWQWRLEGDPDWVVADPDQLKQVFLNCLLNSADAIGEAVPADGGCILLETQTVSGGADADLPDRLVIRVTDNGIGIQDSMREDLFDPFVTSKEPGKGTGLGLSVSLAIVEGMGGRMRLSDNEGPGATVTIELPLVTTEVQQQEG